MLKWLLFAAGPEQEIPRPAQKHALSWISSIHNSS